MLMGAVRLDQNNELKDEMLRSAEGSCRVQVIFCTGKHLLPLKELKGSFSSLLSWSKKTLKDKVCSSFCNCLQLWISSSGVLNQPEMEGTF